MTTATLEAAVPREQSRGAATIVALRDVEKIYRMERIETIALGRIDLTIGTGELVAIMGPSGSGKSTLLHLIGLLDRATTGTVLVAGTDPVGMSDRALAQFRNRTIGFIFQSFHLVHDLSVRDNVELPLLYAKVPGRERRRRAEEALERVGLSARMGHLPAQLSGGQQQRVAIARAIVGKPQLLLADEPTGNLDSQMGSEIMGLLEQLHRDGTTVIMVTHDEALAARTQRIIRVFDGRRVS